MTTNTGTAVSPGNSVTIDVTELQVTDVDSAAPLLTYTVTVAPVDGQLELTTGPGIPISSFTQDDIDNSRLVYVHSGAPPVADSFSFTVSDGAGGSIPANVFVVTVTPNSPPVAQNDAFELTSTPTLTVGPPGILANDTDPENDTLSSVLVTAPLFGSLTLGTDGSVTYTPNAGFVGADIFTYQASDGASLSNVATVTVEVAPPPEFATIGRTARRRRRRRK